MPSAASPVRDELQRGAHVLRLRDVGFDALPHAKPFQRRLAVFSGRHGIDRRHRQLAVAERLGEREVRLDGHLANLAVGRRHQHDVVAEERHPRRLVDQAALLQVVHPVEVGGEEDVGRRRLLDLLGECRARGIADRHRLAARCAVVGDRGVERVLEARGGEDERRVVLRESGGRGRRERQRGSEQQGLHFHEQGSRIEERYSRSEITLLSSLARV